MMSKRLVVMCAGVLVIAAVAACDKNGHSRIDPIDQTTSTKAEHHPDVLAQPGASLVECYSGTLQIYSGHSRGTPSWYNTGAVSFVDAETGRDVVIRGTCVVKEQ